MPPLDLTALREVLQAAGWEAILSADGSELAARRDHPREVAAGVWSLTVDSSGRLRLTVTAPLRAPCYCRMEREGRIYGVRREQQQVITVQSTVMEAGDLSVVLQDLSALVREAMG